MRLTNFQIISSIILVLPTLLGGTICMPNNVEASAKKGKYNDYFLKDDLQVVSITVPQDNLDYLFENAEDEPTVFAEDVTIGDTTLSYVGLKTKGNFTKSETVRAGSHRFSFTINFGAYINKENGYSDKQNFYGVSKISFNNFFFDKTMMKEYCALRLMSEMGVPTPQYGLAKLYINNEYYGVYSMIETFDSSILKQYYHASSADLASFLVKPYYYSPRYYGYLKDSDTHVYLDDFKDEDGLFTWDNMLANDMITETDDGHYAVGEPLKEYSALWSYDDKAFDKFAEEIPNVMNWLCRLTALSNGTDFEGNPINPNSEKYLELLGQVIDIDEALRYFAVQSFVCQEDNLFTWRQNYGLYIDHDGKSILIPWDYDLAWGCNGAPNTPEQTANFDIDTLYNDVAADEHFYSDQKDLFYGGSDVDDYESNTGFPLFHVIYQNDSLMEQFHTYLADCSKITALGGVTSFGETYDALRYSATNSALYEKVTMAARGPLAEGAFYLRYRQPRDVKNGIPALSRVILMRAVGVYLQTENIAATVTGYGSVYGALGNDSAREDWTCWGENIVSVDSNYGIFSIADYAMGAGGPILEVEQVDNLTISKEITNDYTAFSFQTEKEPVGKIKTFIPTADLDDKEIQEVFDYNPATNDCISLNFTVLDNLLMIESDSLHTFIVSYGNDGLDNEMNAPSEESPDSSPLGSKALTQSFAEFITEIENYEDPLTYFVFAIGINVWLFLHRRKRNSSRR